MTKMQDQGLAYSLEPLKPGSVIRHLTTEEVKRILGFDLTLEESWDLLEGVPLKVMSKEQRDKLVVYKLSGDPGHGVMT